MSDLALEQARDPASASASARARARAWVPVPAWERERARAWAPARDPRSGPERVPERALDLSATCARHMRWSQAAGPSGRRER